MEFVGIEKQLFEEFVRKFEYFEHRVMEICNRENDRTLHKWMGNQDVWPVSEHLSPHLADTP